MLLDLVKLGTPMAIKSASIQFSKLFVNSWINSYGVAVSAFASGLHWASVLFLYDIEDAYVYVAVRCVCACHSVYFAV